MTIGPGRTAHAADLSTTDLDLVHAARDGDAAALGALLQRHRAGMLATALGVLADPHQAEDAVQEACLTAVRRIGDLRAPEAWKQWLNTVVRNHARAHLRARTALPVPDMEPLLIPAEDLDPVRIAEQHALGDWLWHAVGLLSPEHQLVMMLRYFSDVTSYEQMAAVCGTPVGTVRSRLSHARARLIDHLQATADLGHSDQRRLTRMRHREAEQTLAAGRVGRYADAMKAFAFPTLETIWGSGKRTYGYEYPAFAMHRDVNDGVTFRLTRVTAGADTLIWETDLLSPPEDPFHCPPQAIWVHTLTGGRSARIRIFHPGVPHPSSIR